MVVPTSKLIWLYGLIALPLSAIAGLMPSVQLVAYAGLLLLVVAGVLDLMVSRHQSEPVAIRAPDSQRLIKHRSGKLTLEAKGVGDPIHVGIEVPRQMELEPDILRIQSQTPDEWEPFQWDCTSRIRGEFSFDTVYVEHTSILGLWHLRNEQQLDLNVRVYPSLHGERKNVAALFSKQGLPGVHAQRQVGQGREFEKLRDYVPGDSYRDIYWKQTAKRNEPITKEYQIEQTQKLYVVLDHSRLSGQTVEMPAHVPGDEQNPDDTLPETTTKLERYIVGVLSLCGAAEHQGDQFGLLTFDRDVSNFLPAGSGKQHYQRCRDALYDLQPNFVNPDFGELFTFLRTRIQKRVLVVVLTSLSDPVIAEQFTEHVDLVSSRHLVLTATMSNPSTSPLFENEHVEDPEDVYRALTGHLRWRELKELETKLHRHGVDLMQIPNERLSSELVTEYVNVKQRQQL